MGRGAALNWTQYISMDPEVCHGKPCFKGTRIMVADVLELREAGEPFSEIKSAYPRLTRTHVQAALRFARLAIESGRHVAFHAAHHATPGQ